MRHAAYAVLAIVVAALCLPATDAVTGVQTTITQMGFDYARQVGVGVLLTKLQTLVIPPITAETGTPIGKVTISITDAALTGVSLPSSSIDLLGAPTNGLKVTVVNVAVGAKFNWAYRRNGWPHVKDHGSGTASVDPSTISVSIAMAASNGRLSVHTTAVSVQLGKVHIHLKGGASWLYNLFIGLFSGKIKSAIESALTNAITNTVNTQLQQILATAPTVAPIKSDLSIDFSLSANPSIATSSYMALPIKGMMFYTPHPVECSCSAVALPDNPYSKFMFQLSLGQYVPNCALSALLQAGRLKLDVTKTDPSWPITLNTGDVTIHSVLPTLYTFCPDCPISLFIAATQPPVTSMSASTGIRVDAVGTITVATTFANGSVITGFVLGMNAMAQADAIVISGPNITGVLRNASATVSLVRSNCGEVKVEDLNMLISMLLQIGTPIVNEALANGIPLPTIRGVVLNAPEIHVADGYLTVGSNVTYVPPRSVRTPKARRLQA